MSTHTVNTVFNGGMAFTADINGHLVKMDVTAEDGGNNSGPSPKRLMLAALAGCTGVDIVSILNKKRVEFSDFSVETEAKLSSEHPKIYEKVKIIYKIKLTESDQHKMKKAVELSQDKYCGVYKMFSAFANVKTEIVYL
jgi:putative redox protein